MDGNFWDKKEPIISDNIKEAQERLKQAWTDEVAVTEMPCHIKGGSTMPPHSGTCCACSGSKPKPQAHSIPRNPEALKLASELMDWLDKHQSEKLGGTDAEISGLTKEGSMFGVLVCVDPVSGKTVVLKAFSGGFDGTYVQEAPGWCSPISEKSAEELSLKDVVRDKLIEIQKMEKILKELRAEEERLYFESAKILGVNPVSMDAEIEKLKESVIDDRKTVIGLEAESKSINRTAFERAKQQLGSQSGKPKVDFLKDETEKLDKINKQIKVLSTKIKEVDNTVLEINKKKPSLANLREIHKNIGQQKLTAEEWKRFTGKDITPPAKFDTQSEEYLAISKWWQVIKNHIDEVQASGKKIDELIKVIEKERKAYEVQLSKLKKTLSDRKIQNFKGEDKTIGEACCPKDEAIATNNQLGACAAPKLLAEAQRLKLIPVSLAEFWYGADTTERKHKEFYESCQFCRSILGHWLCGLEEAQLKLTEALEK